MNKQLVLTICCMLSVFSLTAQRGSYLLWYEYGDGTFYSRSFPDGIALESYLNSNSFPQLDNSNPRLLGMKKVTKVYKPTPPTIALKQISYQHTASPIPPVNTTTSTASLDVFTSTKDFLANDTVLIALTYKKSGAARTLAFFYNKNPDPTFKTFRNTGVSTAIENVQGSTTLPMPDIRTHNQEIASIADARYFANGGLAEGYLNGLTFDISNTDTRTRKNIFLTLFTEGAILTTNAEEFRLVMLDSMGNQEGDSYSKRLINNARLKSHDPNYQIVEPECLLEHEAVGKTLHYKVHFQNTGPGNADSIKTTTYLPMGYTMADMTTTNSNLFWNIGGTNLSTRNINYSAQILPGKTPNELYIEFRKINSASVLLGTASLTDPINDARTMGDFEFDLVVKSPAIAPMNLISYTSIVFDENDSVTTGEAITRIRKCCTCKESDNQNNNNNNQLNCCKRKRMKKWLRWLLCENC